jgi:hypothetical protein
MSEIIAPKNEVRIKFNDVEYVVKKTNKAIIDFEVLAQKKISQLDDSYTDTMTLFYCFLKAANRDTFKYTFDQFLDVLDDNMDSIQVFNDYATSLVKENIKDNNSVKKKK